MESRIRKINVYGKRAKSIVINKEFAAAVESTRRKQVDVSEDELDSPPVVKPATRPRKAMVEVENVVNVKTLRSTPSSDIALIIEDVKPETRQPGKTSRARVVAAALEPLRKSKSSGVSNSTEVRPLPSPVMIDLTHSPLGQSFSKASTSSASEKDDTEDESYRPAAPRRRRKAFKARVVTSPATELSSQSAADRSHSRQSACPAISTSLDVLDELVQGIERVDLRSESSSARPPVEDHLSRLLSLCSQTKPHAFSTWIESPDLWPSLQGGSSEAKRGPGRPSKTRSTVHFRKLGEASFSEVFAARSGVEEEIVLKVVPLLREEVQDDDDDDDEVFRSNANDVAREIEITRRLQEVGQRFVRVHSTFVVQGAYPRALLDEWDAFAKERGSDSPRPDCMSSDQLFGIIVLSHGGVDLESFQFDRASGWQQALEIMRQVIDALAHAEARAKFEHRDLHEGQVLVRQDQSGPSASSGIQVTIVDFGLSRARLESNDVAHADMTEDLFVGVGEQWDVYRKMRDATRGAWQDFHPITNVMWIHYLCRYLLYSTSTLKKPRALRAGSRKVTQTADADRQAYQRLARLEKQLVKILSQPSQSSASAVSVRVQCIADDDES